MLSFSFAALLTLLSVAQTSGGTQRETPSATVEYDLAVRFSAEGEPTGIVLEARRKGPPDAKSYERVTVYWLSEGKSRPIEISLHPVVDGLWAARTDLADSRDAARVSLTIVRVDSLGQVERVWQRAFELDEKRELHPLGFVRELTAREPESAASAPLDKPRSRSGSGKAAWIAGGCVTVGFALVILAGFLWRGGKAARSPQRGEETAPRMAKNAWDRQPAGRTQSKRARSKYAPNEAEAAVDAAARKLLDEAESDASSPPRKPEHDLENLSF